jgi:hypothetical protein
MYACAAPATTTTVATTPATNQDLLIFMSPRPSTSFLGAALGPPPGLTQSRQLVTVTVSGIVWPMQLEVAVSLAHSIVG